MQWFSGSFSSIQRDCSSPSPFWYEKFSLVFIFWKYLLLQPLFIVLGFLLASTLCSSVIRTDSRTCNFWHFSRSYIIRSNNWNGHNHCWAKWWPIPCFSNHRWWAGIPWSIPFFTNISVQIIALLWMRKNWKEFVYYYASVWTIIVQVTRSVDTEFGQLSTQEQMTVDAIVQAR